MIGSNLIQSVVRRFTNLADTASAATGAGMVGFLYATAYAGNTVGAWIKNLATAAGAGFIGYLAAGVGAVLRTLQSKLGETVSVLDFGADPTGTADSTAAINAAAVASKSVYFPPGTYKTTATITIPDNSRWFGSGMYATTISLNTAADIDAIVVGWFTTLEAMTITTNAPGAGSKGVVRLQSLTNANIPTNVGGNNWTNPGIGGLSYKNTLRDLVITNGQNYGLYLVNPGYVTLENVRAVLSRGAAGNLYISGAGPAYGNLPQATTVTIIGGEYTASFAGPGISCSYLYNSVFTNPKTEGNYGRGIVMANCGQSKLVVPYVENNFALGAAKGDADIVVTTSSQISIDSPQVVSSNAFNAIAGTGNTNCTLTNYAMVLTGGAAATLSLDAGWVSSSTAMGIVATGVQSGGAWVKYANGTSVYSKKVNIPAAAITTAAGTLFAQATPQADTDFPSIFMSDGAGGLVFSPSFHCMTAAGGVPIWAVATGASSANNALRYRLVATASTASISVDVYITMTGRWQ